MKVTIAHPTGNSNVRAVTKALQEANLLFRFYTCVAVFQNTLFYFLTNFGILKEFRKRSFSPALKGATKLRPFKELGRLTAEKLGFHKLLKPESGYFSIDKVYQDLDRYTSNHLQSIKAVYAYEDAAFNCFTSAKLLGIERLYDLPTGYWRAHKNLLEIENELHPDWLCTMTFLKDSPEKLCRKDKEISMASAVFVASSFTKKTLELYPKKLPPVYLIPYGFPPVFKNRTYNRKGKIKLLFVGGLTQLKGLANVLEAVDHFIHKIELTVVGKKISNNCLPLEKMLKRHTWIPSLPNDEVLELMRSQDLFIFPSLFEGYGLVITEAMSQGTPVITTRRTCGADFIIDNVNGWLVPAGNTDALIKKIEDILVQPDCLERVGKAAMKTAKELPMTKYGEKMVEAIEDILK